MVLSPSLITIIISSSTHVVGLVDIMPHFVNQIYHSVVVGFSVLFVEYNTVKKQFGNFLALHRFFGW